MKMELTPILIFQLFLLSHEDIRLIRMQNRIEIEGDDIVGPILKFTNIGLQVPVLKKIASMGISVWN